MPYRVRDVEQVAAEIEADGQPYAVFIDNNLGSRPELPALALRGVGASPDHLERRAHDRRDGRSVARSRAMALAGCTGVFIGFESLNAANLDDARKRTPVPDDYARRCEVLHDNGIQVNGSFVLGFDHDGPDVFERTVEWIEANRLECATFHLLTPYPGTPLFAGSSASGASCIAIGGSTTRRTWSSNPRACPPRRYKLATSGATGGNFRTVPFGGGGRRIGAPCRRTSRCRISTSARTGSGTC